MDFLHIVILLTVGTLAGFLNTVAGGGTLITMPILIFLGLPSAVANGTNRIAVMAQNLVAVAGFKKNGFFDWKLGLTLALPAAVGAIAGSRIAVSLSDDIFNKILAVVMILVLVLTLWSPQKKLNQSKETLTRKDRIIGAAVFFGVGIYGGFIQAGVGFIIMAALTLITGYSLVKINSLKAFVIATYSISSLAVFILSGKVAWVPGLCLAAGNSLGAWLGSVFSVKKGDKWIKIILIVTVSVMALQLLGIIKL